MTDGPGVVELVDVGRRRLLGATLAGAAVLAAPGLAQAMVGALDAGALGVKPGDGDQSAALARALARAAKEARPLALPPGRYRVANVALPEGAVLVGAPELTRLELAAPGPLLVAKGVRRIALRGLVLDGASAPADFQTGALHLEDVGEVALDELAVLDAGGSGVVLLRSGGALRRSHIEQARHAGLFCMDGKGVTVSDNLVRGCRNNGVVVRRSAKADDGSVIANNRIEDTGALDGGLGWNGNAVNVSKAGGVMVSGNAIRRSAFSAVRAHETTDVLISGNVCLEGGETALYVEFGFDGAVVSGNLVDGAASGIAAANFREGGKLAAVTGNVLRNLFRRKLLDMPGEGYGLGIGIEAGAAVTGNVIENAAAFGIYAGWGPYLRDVAVSGNVIRECEVGIGVSVVDGAGPTTIAGNVIAGSRKGAVVGYRWTEAATRDLAVVGAAGFPGLTVGSNTIR
ncbi:Tat protein [Methylopila jiangsuensis]|uniref:Tat protein n=1 Tax=Methylopila jiangsuensis TaxID=586230 RepID=A0A9W6N5A1_9HYPH|nr:TIGR03808 family TAT-translocated repetitive protein [Methylopila jiangsuensis]MDR6284410.1 putative secreted repeat protein (TIGR03808 family) [Methylopila jiangsuensis]GLK78205.1 Tat protein [Methylopila jiangsuensis]